EELKLQRQRVERINARLARDNRYKSDFLAIVSHEFRTPLTSILAFTEMIIDNVPESDTETLSQLEEIRKSGAILLEMVDNVLETARIQAGSERLNLELVDVSDVVGMVAAAQSAVAARKGVSLSTSVQADVPLLMSDWEKVRRILTNLTSNAVKFTPSGGRVNVEVSAGEAGKTVIIRVIDTGIGIPKDKQRLVFERFTQENMSTVRRYGGSGLGLSLVNDLVSMLGGEVSVESGPGEGSIFTVVLPVDSTDASREGSGCGQDNAD
ncbi:MAG: HAMP domain-containing sensor histidine kinase, partial [Berryella intestinalis]|nr:HAMP domain-containing sensor histidine kinase [Berryella intestinalis]